MEINCTSCRDGVLPEKAQKTHFLLHIHGVIDARGKFRWEYLEQPEVDMVHDPLLKDWMWVNVIERGEHYYPTHLLSSMMQVFSLFI